MLLCLDVGNTHIFGGVFADDQLLLRFRHKTDYGVTSDQIGIFLKSVLCENNLASRNLKCEKKIGPNPKCDGYIDAVAICSVVPPVDYSLKAACKKYLQLEPFILQAGVKTGVKIKTNNALELGADLIAGAIAAIHYYPNKDLLVVDFGTVTTIVAINKSKEFLGCAFLPGMRTSMHALQSSAAKLHNVEINKPEQATGRFTTESIQSGLYYGHIGAIKEITKRIAEESFGNNSIPTLLATGGFAHLFAQEHIFANIDPDLILHGIRLAHEINNKNKL